VRVDNAPKHQSTKAPKHQSVTPNAALSKCGLRDFIAQTLVIYKLGFNQNLLHVYFTITNKDRSV
jgi:hypothetical protein